MVGFADCGAPMHLDAGLLEKYNHIVNLLFPGCEILGIHILQLPAFILLPKFPKGSDRAKICINIPLGETGNHLSNRRRILSIPPIPN